MWNNIGSHWIAFFKSIQVSTVAIGLLTFAAIHCLQLFLNQYFFKKNSVKGIY